MQVKVVDQIAHPIPLLSHTLVGLDRQIGSSPAAVKLLVSGLIRDPRTHTQAHKRAITRAHTHTQKHTRDSRIRRKSSPTCVSSNYWPSQETVIMNLCFAVFLCCLSLKCWQSDVTRERERHVIRFYVFPAGMLHLSDPSFGRYLSFISNRANGTGQNVNKKNGFVLSHIL